MLCGKRGIPCKGNAELVQGGSAGGTALLVTAQHPDCAAVVAKMYIHHDQYSFLRFVSIVAFHAATGQEHQIDKFCEKNIMQFIINCITIKHIMRNIRRTML